MKKATGIVWRQERPERKGRKYDGIAKLAAGDCALVVCAPTMKKAIEAANKCARALGWKQDWPWERLLAKEEPMRRVE